MSGFDLIPTFDPARCCIYSPCGKYRYTLHRQWGQKNRRAVLFVLLNPSTATDEQDDPTIRRCIGYAKRLGFGRLMIGNIFAFRSTCPRVMRMVGDPVGYGNDAMLLGMAQESDLVVCGWGVHGTHKGRSAEVRHLLREYRLHCLGKTKDGEPRHPLYLRGDLQPEVM